MKKPHLYPVREVLGSHDFSGFYIKFLIINLKRSKVSIFYPIVCVVKGVSCKNFLGFQRKFKSCVLWCRCCIWWVYTQDRQSVKISYCLVDLSCCFVWCGGEWSVVVSLVSYKIVNRLCVVKSQVKWVCVIDGSFPSEQHFLPRWLVHDSPSTFIVYYSQLIFFNAWMTHL